MSGVIQVKGTWSLLKIPNGFPLLSNTSQQPNRPHRALSSVVPPPGYSHFARCLPQWHQTAGTSSGPARITLVVVFLFFYLFKNICPLCFCLPSPANPHWIFAAQTSYHSFLNLTHRLCCIACLLP
ncbi:hypothetical protein VULLAG_LOCUS20357 [Vulpes lagopus]